MPKRQPSKTNFDFSRSYRELEEIVAWFERGDVDLDEALTRYERGLELAAACRRRLAEVENRISSIREKASE